MKRFTIFLLLALTVIQLEAAPVVGKIVQVDGVFEAQERGAKKRSLQLGSQIMEGDTLTTSKNSTGKVEFFDGTSVLLVSDTSLFIDTYKKNRIFIKLYKGGSRFVTGSIPKNYPDNVEVNTPNVTIGFRGTTTVLAHLLGISYVQGVDGTTVMKNKVSSGKVGPALAFQYSTISSQMSRMQLGTSPSPSLMKLFTPGARASKKDGLCWKE